MRLRLSGLCGTLVMMMFVAPLVIALLLASVTSASAEVAVSDQTIEEHTDGYEVQFAYPAIGISNDDALIQDLAQSLLDSFKMSVAARSDSEPPYFARLSYTVKRNDDSAVVIVFDYSIYTGGAHPNFAQFAFNFLMPQGARVFLPDLVGNDGIKRVSDLAIASLTAKLSANGNADKNWIRTGAGPYADNFETFEWLPSEVVLHFDPYAVASYAEGPQQVRLPLGKLQDVLRADPLAPLPSFDCSQATAAIELAVCSDQGLAQLDRRVAEAYAARLRLEALGTQEPSVKAQQIEWLGQRDAACADMTDMALVECLKDQYGARLTALRS